MKHLLSLEKLPVADFEKILRDAAVFKRDRARRDRLPLSGQIAFMVLGPMLDMKLLLMYLGLFRKRVVLTIAASIVLAVLTACLLLEVGFKGRLS